LDEGAFPPKLRLEKFHNKKIKSPYIYKKSYQPEPNMAKSGAFLQPKQMILYF
jgi:hypothetical protein